VASPNFRHPVPFARELITLDDISSGRLNVGLGAGGLGWDATILGNAPWSLTERAERFREFVALLDRLLRQPATSHAGRFYSAENAPMQPGCIQQPRVPFAIAATGPRGMRVAAEHADTWVTTGDRTHEGPPLPPTDGAEVIRRQLGLLNEACKKVGRDPASVNRLVLTGPRLDAGLRSPAEFQELKETYAAVGVTDLVVHWPRPSDPYSGEVSVLESIMSRSR
jgi:alkanesulfonate monooxygenase SsuD/methylene tetrahydromethanopterin reductase-like flavin-dependent oxidoreductase (luciferase family)